MECSELLRKCDRLITLRAEEEAVWAEVAFYAGEHNAINSTSMSGNGHTQQGREAARKRYDVTLVKDCDYLSSSLVSLVAPQGQKWHSFKIADTFEEQAAEVTEWCEAVRDYLFYCRDLPESNFKDVLRRTMRGVVTFGHGAIFVEGNKQGKGCRYRHIPYNQLYIDKDYYGNVTTVLRKQMLTAAQAMQRWGEECSQEIKDANKEQSSASKQFEFNQLVCHRHNYRDDGVKTNKNMPFAEYIVDVTAKKVMSEGGFLSMPYIVFFWQRDDDATYSTSPAMLALSEAKAANMVQADILKASSQLINPPLFVNDKNGLGRINMNPGSVNAGYVNADGKPLAIPLQSQANPAIGMEILAQHRRNIDDLMYVSLFQLLTNSTNDTATEAIMKEKEKAELLSPIGSNIQSSLALMAERELDILIEQGFFSEGSPFRPPDEIGGGEIHIDFTAPIDRMRQMPELTGINQTISALSQMAQLNPDVMNIVDFEAISRHIASVNGVPMKVLKTPKELAAIAQEKAKQEKMAQSMQMAQQAGAIAKDVIPVMAQMKDSGIADDLAPLMQGAAA